MSDQYISWSWSLPKLERNGLRIWELARQRSPWKLMLEHGQGGSSHHLHIGAGKCKRRGGKSPAQGLHISSKAGDAGERTQG